MARRRYGLRGDSSTVNIGYSYGHPTGSDLTKAPHDEAPKFLMYAVRDPKGANLDRIQIVKGWVDADGQAHEKIYDVALAGAPQDHEQGRLMPIASTVNVTTGNYANIAGAPAMSAYGEDPEFDGTHRAFYYLRVIQIPTARHTLADAVALGMDPRDTGHPPVIQERAYSSPIWCTP